MKTTMHSCILMSLIFLTPVACAFVTVGTDVACTYDNLEDAYNDDDIFVRVTTQVTFNDNFVITKPKWFTGGYASCLDIYNGNPPVENARTKWQSTDNNTVIKINAQLAANSTIVIDGFEIFNGVNNNPYLAGGIQVEGNSQLLLSNSSVYDNLGASGGGIMVAGENAGVLINNSLIHDNESQLGGGIFCEDHASVSILGESAINNNEAEVGGGIWGNEECEIQMNSGDTLAPLDAQYGILRNTARVGGGAYLIGGSNMEIKGSTEHPASILLNIADTEDIESGGGVFLSDPDTRFEAINGRIESNIGVFYGAGFAVQNQAVFVMRRLPGDCWDNSRCSSLSNNILTSSQDSEVGYGGAGDLYEGGVANISQTRIDGNLANTASGFNLDEYAYLRSEGNLIINNRDFNNDTDTTLINVLGSPGNGSNVDMFYNTLANNTTTAPMIRAVNDSQQIINVFNSIIDHTSSDILGFFNNAPHNSLLQWECLFVSEVTSLAGNIGFVSTEDPMFVNKVQSNYRLSPASPAIDACDESAFIGASYPDFDGRDRGIDEPGIQNLFGPFDVGAYEANVDIIFANGFE